MDRLKDTKITDFGRQTLRARYTNPDARHSSTFDSQIAQDAATDE